MLKDLTSTQRHLLASFFLFGLASPMVVIYANTLLWRQSENVMTLGVFNIGNYFGLAIGFLLNAFLLKHFNTGRLYALGCLLQGLVPILMVALGAQVNAHTIPLGLALGIAQGFFWANRNVLTSKFTQGPSRYRFISIETALGIVSGVLPPLLIGWFIAFGDRTPFYTVEQAYQITSVIGFLFLLWSGWHVRTLTIESFDVKDLRLHAPSKLWNTQRLIEILNGFASGIESVLPLVIILLFLGQEGAVGTMKALTAILSAVVIYTIGKRVKHNHHTQLFATWILFNLTGAIVFSLWHSPTTALTYFILSGLVGSLRWSSFSTVMYEVIDKEVFQNGTHRFLYLLDRELFLNTGRVAGLIVMLAIFYYSSDLLARYGLILISLVQIPNLFLLDQLIKQTDNS